MNKFRQATIKAEALESIYDFCEDRINWLKERRDGLINTNDEEEPEWLKEENAKTLNEIAIKILVFEDIQEILEKELKR